MNVVLQPKPGAGRSHLVETEAFFDGSLEVGTLASIYFQTDSAELNGADRAIIVQTSRLIEAITLSRPLAGCVAKAKIYGFADYRGTERHNFALAKSRANAVWRELGTNVRRICSQYSHGESSAAQPVGKNPVPKNRLAADRRVDIELQILNWAQHERKRELVKTQKALRHLKRVLENNKKYEAYYKLGPLAGYVSSDRTHQNYQWAVKELESIDTRNKSTVEGLGEVLSKLGWLPVIFLKLIWVTYTSPTRDFVDTMVGYGEVATGTAPDGAGMTPQEVEEIRESMRQLESALDEEMKCELVLAPPITQH